MSLRSKIVGLVGTLILAVSPTAIVLAQDAQAPTSEAPAAGKPSVEDILRRHKQREQATPDAAGQENNGGPAATPKIRKPAPATDPPPPEAPAAPVITPEPATPKALAPKAVAPEPATQSPAATPDPAAPTLTHKQPQGPKQSRQKPTGPVDNGNRPQDAVKGPDQGQARPGQDHAPQVPTDKAAEQRAIGLLGDNSPLDGMNDQQLRQRLGQYRSVLAGGNLSDATQLALIQRLEDARNTLRNRVSLQGDNGPRNSPRGRNPQFGRPQFQQGSPRLQDIPAILADRRPSQVLTVDQLNRRILVYRDATTDQRYSPEDRDAFAEYLQSDRSELRRRLLNERGQRNDRLSKANNGMRLDMDIAPRGPHPQSVWAAEVGENQIEQQFAARPLRPLPRRFSRADFFARPEVVMAQPFVRQSIRSVELDTIHFGFNESDIREEEVANLDRVGRVIERIVAGHTNEVFVIEGNTDAVGDDDYNLCLSRARAQAVKLALTQYYVIPEDNLVAAGLGERYLKIPTPEPEQENRRVTIRRVTPLLQN